MCRYFCIGLILDMIETNNIYPGLSAPPLIDQQFMLNRINEIKYYFVAEIKKSELMSKRLSKYVASFDYFDNSFFFLFFLFCQ